MKDQTTWRFLREGHLQFGVFYPDNYTVAAFADPASAQRAAAAAREAGFDAADVHVLEGATMLRRLQDDSDAGLLDRLLASLAEVVGNERALVERDMDEARRGSAFLFVYSPEDGDGRRIAPIIEEAGALYARRYLPIAIEHLVDAPGARH